MTKEQVGRVNAARLARTGISVLIQVGTAAAVTVRAVRGQRDVLDGGGGAFEVVWVDDSQLPLTPVDDGKTFVTLGADERPMVVKAISKPDPFGLMKLVLARK